MLRPFLSPRLPLLFALLVVPLSAGCPGASSTASPEAQPEVDGGETEGDGGVSAEPEAPFGDPRTDLVPRIGRDDAVDVATWNIENFPATVDTPLLVADLIASMDLDIVAVQEIADTVAFEELDLRLPGYATELSSHTYGDGNYQKLGLIYRRDLVTINGFSLLFTGSGYAFPRPPIRASITIDDGVNPPFDFTLISVHLKAGGGPENEERRRLATAELDAWIQQQIAGSGDDEIILLGDFNQTIDNGNDPNVLVEFFENSDVYRFQTATLAERDVASFIPGDRLIDHIVTTAAFDDELVGAFARIPPLEAQLGNYENAVSDHLPVVIPIPILP